MQTSQLSESLNQLKPRLQQEIQSCLTILQANLGHWPRDSTQKFHWQKLRKYAVNSKLRRGQLTTMTNVAERQATAFP